jgi:hypothetical protein
MRCRNGLALPAAAAMALTFAPASPLAAQDEEKIAIEDLLKAGWQIAGYTSAVDDRSTFLLLRHPSELYLVQCRSGYDVTRKPRVYSNCYKLR